MSRKLGERLGRFETVNDTDSPLTLLTKEDAERQAARAREHVRRLGRVVELARSPQVFAHWKQQVGP